MRSSMLLAVAVAAAALHGAAGAGGHGVNWSTLEFKARKFLLSATAEIGVREVDRATALEKLRAVPGETDALAPGSTVVAVTTVTDMPFGREETATAWVDPESGQALQAEKTVAGGGKYYWKLRRYLGDGYHRWRASPSDRQERDAGPEGWSDRSERDYRWPSIPGSAAVTDSYALLYLISAARLDREDARLEILLSSKERVVELRFEAAQLVRRDEEWTETWSGGSRDRSGSMVLRRVEGAASSADGGTGDEEIDTGFFGMKGPLTLYVERGTGMPVVVEGTADGIGHLEVKLRRVELRAAPTEGGDGP